MKFSVIRSILIVLALGGSVNATPPFPAIAAGSGGAAMGASPPEVTDAIRKALMFDFSTANVWLQEVRFNQVGVINGNSPVMVHVIIFYDEASYKTIGALNSDQYFQQADQIERDYRATIEVYKYEIPPGVKMDPQCISPRSAMGKACGIFARYATPGAHRYNVGSDRIIQINLGPNDFNVKTIKS